MYCENQIIQTRDDLTPRCSYVCALDHKCKIEMIYLEDLGVRWAENGNDYSPGCDIRGDHRVVKVFVPLILR